MKKTKLSAALLSIVCVASLVSCGGGGSNPSIGGSSSSSNTGASSIGGSSSSSSGDKSYTYNTYLATNPKTWNTHNWQTSDESYITSFTEIGLYDTILNSTKDGYEFVTEMASEFPVAVDPADLSDNEIDTYFASVGNPAAGMVWDIKLNKGAKWQDGTPITSNDYVQSMERQLNPKFANYRADGYYNGNFVIANAEGYYKQGRSTIEAAYNYIDLNTGNFLDPSSQGDDGMWYINLGRYTPYVASIFTNADSDTTLYTVLNNRSSRGSDALELAAQRLTDAVSYYLLDKFQNSPSFVEANSAFYSNNQSDWDNATSAKDVKSTMLTNHPDIELDEFNTNDVYVRSVVDQSDLSEESTTRVKYSSTLLKKDLSMVVSSLGRGGATSASWNWELPLFASIYNSSTVDWGDVGIVAKDDYSFRLYLGKAITSLNLKFTLSSNWLVNVPLYDKLTKDMTTETKSTSYATNDVNNYMSYGPYKLTKFESGKTIHIEKNPNWYGYTDGKHVGQFQMTAINTQIITNHDTAMTLFKQGQLDDIDLTFNDMKTFGGSSRRQTTYESYTQKISFNTDYNSLAGRQQGSANKTLLSNKDFRMGLSLGMNRNSFASTTTAGSKAFTGLLNDLYLADVAKGQSYRNTDQGKSVYSSVYGKLGGNPYDANYTETALSEKSNGYNRNMSTFYLAKGIKEELNSTKDGHLKKGDTLDIEFRVYDDTAETTVAMRDFIVNSVTSSFAEANKKLLEDGTLTSESEFIKFHLETKKDENYYETAKQGNYDMIFSTWGGAAINPYGLMEVYCSATFGSCCEYGFKGKQDKETIAIDMDGNGEIDQTNEIKSYNAWYSYMNDSLSEAAFGDEISEGDPNYQDYLAVHNKKLNILAGLEAGIINRFECIPLVARGSSTLTSFKVDNATDVYVSLIGYGGIRFMTFNYTDSEWSSFVASKNNDLTTLYQQ